ncbi:hypothetical protein [Paenibacillus sp. MMS20-IR301]|uniref:hypothetical protein n=1 Tax=Paenibacillus sp. MMS20-IR301 TaxID=2895946 RepID=UPI0028E9BA52|nr:hypothetical protein [Paenibacillus sp. MMS20-IR301]WNS46821.1 hypothetical protein LOS79_02740 [Paenibacillus sp. MMS20-IR301]
MSHAGHNQIKARIPHRYPLLLVDRITGQEEGKRATGIKNVSIGEPYMTGHFPGYPVMPGVLIVEALCSAEIMFAFSGQ